MDCKECGIEDARRSQANDGKRLGKYKWTVPVAMQAHRRECIDRGKELMEDAGKVMTDSGKPKVKCSRAGRKKTALDIDKKAMEDAVKASHFIVWQWVNMMSREEKLYFLWVIMESSMFD